LNASARVMTRRRADRIAISLPLHTKGLGRRHRGRGRDDGPFGAEPLTEDVARASALVALPNDDECPTRIGGHGGGYLNVRRVGFHPGRPAGRRSRAAVALADEAVARAVLGEALPDDDEAPSRTARDGGRALLPRRVGVHPELRRK